MERYYKLLCADSPECRRAIGVSDPNGKGQTMEAIDHLLLLLRQHGLYAEVSDPARAAKNSAFFAALADTAASCAAEDDDTPESGEELPEHIAADGAAVLMGHGIPFMGHTLRVAKRKRCPAAETKAAVDAFFDMLPGSRGKSA